MTSWLEYHIKSEEAAKQAEIAMAAGESARAEKFYSEAADAEVKAISYLPKDKRRTLGISVISAAALLYKACRFVEAESFACRWLTAQDLAPSVNQDLRSVLSSIWSEEARRESSLSFYGGQIEVSIDGGLVVHGGAPLDLVLDKMKTIEGLVTRTIEHDKKLPLRRRGAAPDTIRKICEPYLFQAPPGSYQFAVAVRDPSQQSLFPEDKVEGRKIVDRVMAVLRAAIGGKDTITAALDNPEYHKTMLRLVRNLAPTGKSYQNIRFRVPGEKSGMYLSTDDRKSLAGVLRPESTDKRTKEELKVIVGVLRAVDLDEDYLEIATDTGRIEVKGLTDMVDDVIGPMVNKTVTVDVAVIKGKHKFRDIQVND